MQETTNRVQGGQASVQPTEARAQNLFEQIFQNIKLTIIDTFKFIAAFFCCTTSWDNSKRVKQIEVDRTIRDQDSQGMLPQKLQAGVSDVKIANKKRNSWSSTFSENKVAMRAIEGVAFIGNAEAQEAERATAEAREAKTALQLAETRASVKLEETMGAWDLDKQKLDEALRLANTETPKNTEALQLAAQVADLNQQIGQLQGQVATIAGINLQIQQKDADIQLRDEFIQQDMDTISHLSQEINEKDAIIFQKDYISQQKDVTIGQKDEKIAKQKATIKEQRDQLLAQAAIIEGLKQRIGELQEKVAGINLQIQQKEADIQLRDEFIQQDMDTISHLSQEINEKDAIIFLKDEKIQRERDKILQLKRLAATRPQEEEKTKKPRDKELSLSPDITWKFSQLMGNPLEIVDQSLVRAEKKESSRQATVIKLPKPTVTSNNSLGPSIETKHEQQEAQPSTTSATSSVANQQQVVKPKPVRPHNPLRPWENHDDSDEVDDWGKFQEKQPLAKDPTFKLTEVVLHKGFKPQQDREIIIPHPVAKADSISSVVLSDGYAHRLEDEATLQIFEKFEAIKLLRLEDPDTYIVLENGYAFPIVEKDEEVLKKYDVQDWLSPYSKARLNLNDFHLMNIAYYRYDFVNFALSLCGNNGEIPEKISRYVDNDDPVMRLQLKNATKGYTTIGSMIKQLPTHNTATMNDIGALLWIVIRDHFRIEMAVPFKIKSAVLNIGLSL